jgi:hypothetical protein
VSRTEIRKFIRRLAGGDDDLSFSRNGVHGIADQVHKYLVQPPGGTTQRAPRDIMFFDQDPPVQFVLHQQQHRVDGIHHIHALELASIHARKCPQVEHQLLHPVQAFLHLSQAGPGFPQFQQ